MSAGSVFRSLFVGAVLAFTLPASAQLTITSQKNHSYKPAVPEALVEFSFIEMKKSLRLPKEPAKNAFLMTDTRAILKTQTVADLEAYSIVQWIKGCQFESSWDGKKRTNTLSIARIHIGETKVFQHLDWEIDSDNFDPVYSSYEGLGRFSLLRWNADPKSFEPSTAVYYADHKPPHPIAFVTDLPGSAFFQGIVNMKYQSAKNVSLELKTCLFRSTDVPAISDAQGSGVDNSKALVCFDWDHKYVFNFKKGKFVAGGPIDPACAQTPN